MIEYRDQVSFARRHIKLGNITHSGTWQHGRAWGQMWGGMIEGYYVSLHTIGDGPLMVPGSFHVRFVGKEKVNS